MINGTSCLISKLCKYDIEINNLGHFAYYYVRCRKTRKRIKIDNYQSQRFIDLLRKSSYITEFKSKTTEEVGGTMIRKVYRISVSSTDYVLNDSFMKKLSMSPYYLLSDINPLERDNKISLVIK